MVNKTEGKVEVFGYDIDTHLEAAKAHLGLVPQEFNFSQFETLTQILVNQAGYYGVPRSEAHKRADKYLAQLGLLEKKDKQARTLSGGMKRRLMIARALMHEPKLLILDEPTAGVDVELRQQLWSYVKQLREQGTTILLTTHYLEEAQALCDQIAIINKGKLVTCQATDDLLRTLDSKELIVTVDKDLAKVPENLLEFRVELRDSRKLVFHIPHKEFPVDKVLSAVKEGGFSIRDLTTKESDLEKIFLLLTQEKSKTN